VTGRRRRRRKLLDDLKERRGYSHLKEDALDRTMWRACFGRGFGPVVRQTAKWMNVRQLWLVMSTNMWLINCTAFTIWYISTLHAIYHLIHIYITCHLHTGTKLHFYVVVCLENNTCELHNMSSDSTTVSMLQIVVWQLHPMETAHIACHIRLTLSLIMWKLSCF
jgi:hypothetical protein